MPRSSLGQWRVRLYVRDHFSMIPIADAGAEHKRPAETVFTRHPICARPEGKVPSARFERSAFSASTCYAINRNHPPRNGRSARRRAACRMRRTKKRDTMLTSGVRTRVMAASDSR